MSSIGPNVQRIHSQREFEDSLNTLNQLSRGELPHHDAPVENAQSISWEEAAEDLELFLSQNPDMQKLNTHKLEQ